MVENLVRHLCHVIRFSFQPYFLLHRTHVIKIKMQQEQEPQTVCKGLQLTTYILYQKMQFPLLTKAHCEGWLPL